MPLPAINRLPLRFERDRLTREGLSFYTRHFTLVTAPTPPIIPTEVEKSQSTNDSSLRGGKVDVAIQENGYVIPAKAGIHPVDSIVIPTEMEESQSTKTSVIPGLTRNPVPARLSILLSKKTARHAVDRNRIRRRTSALLLELLSQFPPADYLIIPKRSVLDTPLPELLADLSTLLPKLK